MGSLESAMRSFPCAAVPAARARARRGVPVGLSRSCRLPAAAFRRSSRGRCHGQQRCALAGIVQADDATLAGRSYREPADPYLRGATHRVGVAHRDPLRLHWRIIRRGHEFVLSGGASVTLNRQAGRTQAQRLDPVGVIHAVPAAGIRCPAPCAPRTPAA